jgi:hypothetical protein
MKKWGRVIGDYFGGVGQLSRQPENLPIGNNAISEKNHWTMLNCATAQTAKALIQSGNESHEFEFTT